MRLFAARTGAKGVVSIEGSVRGGRAYLPALERMVPEIAAGLLDADTKRRTKDALRNLLAERGASLAFTADANRIFFRASCFPEDVTFIYKLIVECLTEAEFKATEIKHERLRQLGELKEAESETWNQAERAFSQLVFAPDHVNYLPTFAEDTDALARVGRRDLTNFQKLFGRDGLIVATAGDIAPDETLKAAERAFSALPLGIPRATFVRNGLKAASREKLVTIPDKANIDAFIGMSIPLDYRDPQYLPCFMLVDMLGGAGIFTGHLMSTVRERDGLTYGIHATLAGFGAGTDGALRITAAFSPENYQRGLDTTLNETRTFLRKNLTDERLTANQDKLDGYYAISLSTSRGVSSALHKLGREGRPLSYLDEYPALLRAITVDDLRTVARLIDPEKFAIAAAGSFKK